MMFLHRTKLGSMALLMGLAGLYGTAQGQAAPGYTITPVMNGLVTPRGLAFAPDGSLYVTEVGRGGGVGAPSLVAGSGSTAYLGYNGAVTRLSGGVQTRVLTGLPSLAAANGSDAGGLQDIVFDGSGQAYGLFGLGANPVLRDGLGAFGASFLGTVARLDLNGSGNLTAVADVARFEALNNPGGGAIDSNPFKFARRPDGSFIVTDAGGNSFLNVSSTGVVAALGVLPARPNPLPFGPPNYEAVPTGVNIGPDGRTFVGQLTGFPFPPGAANVYGQDAGGGAIATAYAGFTNIIDLDFDASGNLYVLQVSSNGLASPNGPGTGLLLRVDRQTGVRTTIASAGLQFPGGLAIQEGPDGPVFYVSNLTSTPDGGTVLRIAPIPEPGSLALMTLGVAVLTFAAWRRRC